MTGTAQVLTQTALTSTVEVKQFLQGLGTYVLPVAAILISLWSASFNYAAFRRRKKILEHKLMVFRHDLQWAIKGAKTNIERADRSSQLPAPELAFSTNKNLYDTYEITDQDLAELAALGTMKKDNEEFSLTYVKIRLKSWYALMKSQSSDGFMKMKFESRQSYQAWRDGYNEVKQVELTLALIEEALERLK